MFPIYKDYFDADKLPYKIDINKIQTNKDVLEFVKKINLFINESNDINKIDNIINQNNNDVFEDIKGEYNNSMFNIIKHEHKVYYSNLKEYIENILEILKQLIEPSIKIVWGDGSLIPFIANKLYEITICINQIEYDEQTEYYKITVCTISDYYLIKNKDDEIHRKLLFHNFTMRGHFDIIINKNHQSLNKDNLVNNKLK